MKIFSRLLPQTIDPLKLAALGVAAWSTLLGSCSQTPITVNLHALQSSGNVSFVCHGDDNPQAGHKLDECPEYMPDGSTPTRRLFGLVTQTATNEVAVVDLTGGVIVDDDLSTPGYSFLRVGAQPGAIVSTPGGAASFVGVTGLQKNGIFALPSTCLTAPPSGTPARDVTSWSACHLSSAPGDITVVLDTANRDHCENKPVLEGGGNAACPSDLSAESGPPGRRKLLVALPEEHKLVLLDAQSLLLRDPGKFEDCSVENEFPLDAPMSAASPLPPEDGSLDSTPDPNVCPLTPYPDRDPTIAPTPGGFANAGDRVYVADRTRPVVHRLDMTDPCVSNELPPLMPVSYSAPNRVVTTSRIAVSPLTPAGKRFLYAVDDNDQPTASVMAFDLTNEKNLTSLIFDGAPRLPYLPPDRLRFSAPVRDVSFIVRDFPKPDPVTGAGQFGLSCSPFTTDNAQNSPAAQYRPNSDFTDGARPLNLRGVFGFAMLTNGQIAVIDVEDFDAACRVPIQANPLGTPDSRGCKGQKLDPDGNLFYTDNGLDSGVPLVTNESSCNVIETHRPRSASLSISNTTVGLRAPTLRTFPQFANPDPSSVITADQQPHMLAVNDPNPDPTGPPLAAQVNVSARLYQACVPDSSGATPDTCDTTTTQTLITNPDTPTVQNSLTLPLVEPRSYAQDESPSLTFEGRVFPERKSGFLKIDADTGTATLLDPDASFCTAGVEDSDAIAVEAESLSIPAPSDAWRGAHADYVQITGDVPIVDDTYWSIGYGATCQALLGDVQSAGSRDACLNYFGNIDNPAVLNPTRDLSITAAYSDHLQVTPRACNGAEDCAKKLAQMSCCFPSGTAYTVRASNQWLLSAAAGLTDMGPKADRRCVHTASCDPRKKFFHSRAFEVCKSDDPDAPDPACTPNNPTVGCVVSRRNLPLQPTGPGNACIFENLTARFAVYRGKQPSVRGMTFTWQTTGGFVPLTMSLTSQSSAVNPQSMSYLPELGYLAVIDGSTIGLTLFDLNSLGVVIPSPYF